MKPSQRKLPRASTPVKAGLVFRDYQNLYLLLLLPGVALYQLARQQAWPYAWAVPLVASLLAHEMIYRDKLLAQAGAWRTPESILHWLEFAGGWPGSFLAQRRFRHKIVKRSYQFTFWLIVVLYEIVALDYLLHGPISHWALDLLRKQGYAH